MIRNFRILPAYTKNLTLVRNRRIPTIANFSTTQRVVSSVPRNTNSKDEKGHKNESGHTDKDRQRMGNYYSMLIASAVGIVGSSYILFQRFSKVEAKELGESAESLLDKNNEKSPKDNSTANNEVTLHKSQAGFRDRKVKTRFFLYDKFSHSLFLKL